MNEMLSWVQCLPHYVAVHQTSPRCQGVSEIHTRRMKKAYCPGQARIDREWELEEGSPLTT